MSKVKEGNEAAPYDPFQHRVVSKPISNKEVFIHMLKGCVGTGILALPEALKNSGLIVGTIITSLSGFIIIHCMLLIVRVQNDRCRILKVPYISYGEAMKYALEDGPKFLNRAGKAAPFIIDAYLSAYQFGTCCVYVVFIAVNLKYVTDIYVIELEERTWMLILLLPMILLNLLRDLKVLAPVSQVANIIMFTGVGIILYFVFHDLPGFENRILVGSPMSYPNTFGTALFALSPVAVVLTLESEMKTPRSFGGWFGVLNTGMLTILCVNVFVAFFGYLRYGDETLSSLSLNIPQDSIVAHLIRGLYAIVIFLTYSLQFYVPLDILWNRYVKQKITKNQLIYEYMFRIALVVGTFILAIAIPLLGLIISLVGALILACLGIVFPAIMDICHYWPDRLGPYKIVLWKDLVLLFIGLMVLIVGTSTSVKDIVYALQKTHT